MREYSETDRLIGLWAAISMAALGVIYVTTGAIGVMVRPPSSELLRQVDPFLAILESLIVLSGVALITLMAAVHAYAPSDKKTYSLVSLALMIAFAVITCSVHFVTLTVGRQIEAQAMPQLAQQFRYTWPTVVLSLDLLAWDFFLGLSLLFAAAVFKGNGLQARVRTSMIASGTLCLAGIAGPLSGYVKVQFLAIAGYAFVLPLACVFLALLFARERVKQKTPS